MIIMKFGGTSVGNAERIKDVARIVTDYYKIKGEVVVVVSAMSTVTNLLISSANSAVKRERKKVEDNIVTIEMLHRNTVNKLGLKTEESYKLLRTIEGHIISLRDILEGVYVLGEVTKRGLDTISSFGERLSVHLVSSAIKNLGVEASPQESSVFIVTDNNFGSANPILSDSEKKTKSILNPIIKQGIVPIVTGFIGSTKEGISTTLGRGGSDFSATILGYCLDANEVWIWTDVDGVMTADPKVVRNAKSLKTISFDEAAELSYFGAKVLHPSTIIPACLKNIPVFIKNTFRPSFAGTKISACEDGNGKGVKAITSINHLSMVTLQGKGMIGIPGTAAKLFGSLASRNINVMFISQASSEHNISFIIQQEDGEEAVELLKEAFSLELLQKRIESIRMEKDVAILAVIGEGMKGTFGVAGKVFGALGAKKINIVAIAQGSSELNISIVIRNQDLIKGVRSLHQIFALNK